MYGNYCSIDRWEKSGGWISRSSLSLLVVAKGLNWKGSWSCWAICNLCGSQRSYWNRSTRIRHTDLFSSCKPLIFYAGSCFNLIESQIRVYGPRSQTEDWAPFWRTSSLWRCFSAAWPQARYHNWYRVKLKSGIKWEVHDEEQNVWFSR